MISVGSEATTSAVGMIDDTVYERAIAEELAARVEAYGSVHAYTTAFDIERRNFTKYLKGVRTPTLPVLMRHLQNLQVEPGDFFDSVNERVKLSK